MTVSYEKSSTKDYSKDEVISFDYDKPSGSKVGIHEVVRKLDTIQEGAQVNPEMKVHVTNGGYGYILLDDEIVPYPFGQMNVDNGANVPTVVLTREEDTLTASVINDGAVLTTLEEIFPLGCLKWYVDPDFTDESTRCIETSVGSGVPYTDLSLDIGSYAKGTKIVCRLEY